MVQFCGSNKTIAMFDSLCAYPLQHELFALAVHPTLPLIAVGLSSGHVATLRLPPASGDGKGRRGSTGTDMIEAQWRTKRHQDSCRAVAYSVDEGAQLCSAGADGLVKSCDSETGQVTGKVAIPLTSDGKVDPPTVLHALSPQTLLLATDAGALHLFDLRDPAPSLPLDKSKTAFISGKPAQTHHPHTDYISSITALPASATSTSGYSKQWLSTSASGTLALTDLRRGVLTVSEDQDELLLSSLYVSGLPTKRSTGRSGESLIVGQADGVLTLWEKGQWQDQESRIVVSKDKETVDVLQSVPDGVGGFGKRVAVGLGDGRIRFVRLGMNQVVGEVVHDEVEGVVGMGFDVEGRMISGGGSTIKVWAEAGQGSEREEDEGDEKSEQIRGSDAEGDDSDEQQEEADSSEEEEKPRKRRKKSKRNRGPATVKAGPSFAGLD